MRLRQTAQSVYIIIYIGGYQHATFSRALIVVQCTLSNIPIK